MEQSNGTLSRPLLHTSTALDISLPNEQMVTPQLVVTMNTLSSMRHQYFSSVCHCPVGTKIWSADLCQVQFSGLSSEYTV